MIVGQYRVGSDSPYKDIGTALATLSWMHVGRVDGQRGLGFSYDSCNAAVAVDPTGAIAAGYNDTPANLGIGGIVGSPFNAVYGSSRLYAGLDPVGNQLINWQGMNNPFSSSPAEQHAEQSAIAVSINLGLDFWTYTDGQNHLYVDFTPCENCEPWLEDRVEEWVVHYGVPLPQKADFRKGRVKRRAELRKEWTKEAKEARKASATATAKIKRTALVAANRRT